MHSATVGTDTKCQSDCRPHMAEYGGHFESQIIGTKFYQEVFVFMLNAKVEVVRHGKVVLFGVGIPYLQKIYIREECNKFLSYPSPHELSIQDSRHPAGQSFPLDSHCQEPQVGG